MSIQKFNFTVLPLALALNLYGVYSTGRTVFVTTSTMLAISLLVCLRSSLVARIRIRRIDVLTVLVVHEKIPPEQFEKACQDLEPSHIEMVFDLGKWRYKDWWLT